MKRLKKYALIICMAAVFSPCSIFTGFGANASQASNTDKPPNIVFLLIDTLRADHLKCYGYPRDTSPFIDKISENGIRFAQFYSVCNWTNPTIAALFSGQYPQSVLAPAVHRDAIRQVLPNQVDTLAETLKNHGYRTIGLQAHPGINAKHGYAQGFDEYIMLNEKWGVYDGGQGRGWPKIDKKFVEKEFSEALDRSENGPFFLYTHVVYPHQPYKPQAPYDNFFGPGYDKPERKNKQGMINAYDGEIRYTDDLVRRVFELLRQRDLLKNTWFVITSDHGEAFWEHGFWEHGKTFFNEEIRIPLILYPPEGQTREKLVVHSPASNIDIFPTICQIAKVPVGDHVAGMSLTRFFAKHVDENQRRAIFSQSPHSVDIHAMSVMENNMKYIYSPGKDMMRHQMYNLIDDPFEKTDISDSQEELKSKLHSRLVEHIQFNEKRRNLLQKQSIDLNPGTIKALKSLGYLK